MPRRPNAILISDSVSVVGMLVLIVGCYHIARHGATSRDLLRLTRGGRVVVPMVATALEPQKRSPGWRLGF